MCRVAPPPAEATAYWQARLQRVAPATPSDLLLLAAVALASESTTGELLFVAELMHLAADARAKRDALVAAEIRAVSQLLRTAAFARSPHLHRIAPRAVQGDAA